MRTPIASFVIPVYNGAAYLAETLDSCVRQTQLGVEIIVVDDGSTDHTGDMLAYFAAQDPRIRIIKHETNQGRSAARNTGIAAAQTSVLLMMDADDLALPCRAKETLRFFRQNEHVDLTYTKFQLIDELGSVKGFCDADFFDEKKLRSTKFMFIGHSTMAFRREVFEKVQYTGGDYSKHCIDDWKFQMDALRAGFKFAPLRKMTTQYRVIPKPRDEQKILELKNACLETVSC